MQLYDYKTTPLEDRINRLYQINGINNKSYLTIDTLSQVFNIQVEYWPTVSKAIYDEEYAVIFLNEDLPIEERRADFFHELGHVMQHYGDQRNMTTLFKNMQENQASHFQLYAAMPIYMIKSLDQYKLSSDFAVPLALVQDRLTQIKRRIINETLYRSNMVAETREHYVLSRSTGK